MLWLSTGGDDVITVEGESCVAEESVSSGKEGGVAEEGVSGGGKEGHPRSSLVGEDQQQWRRPAGSSGDSKSKFPIFQGSGPRGSAFWVINSLASAAS